MQLEYDFNTIQIRLKRNENMIVTLIPGLQRQCNYEATTIAIAYKQITKVLRIQDSQ